MLILCKHLVYTNLLSASLRGPAVSREARDKHLLHNAFSCFICFSANPKAGWYKQGFSAGQHKGMTEAGK